MKMWGNEMKEARIQKTGRMKEETAETVTRLLRANNKELAPVAELSSAADSREKQKEPSNKLKARRHQPRGGGGGGGGICDIPASVQPCRKVASR